MAVRVWMGIMEIHEQWTGCITYKESFASGYVSLRQYFRQMKDFVQIVMHETTSTDQFSIRITRIVEYKSMSQMNFSLGHVNSSIFLNI